ncbi:histidine kinase dimerization/phosphoacceptor domain -containing protein [Mycoplana rhizolycopersici]|uniref:histidine kinase n=1 Tax=Mycoplana rhizolycopersici TaxID=2746702 RepID=A0ABX2Q7L1_9HYPH|nr:histidine kinase dimerization/phosphoacceptor domain -containing protein [Rhizobium rhizolycopersici]NVP53712.1 response regulator [Rhizobium rhizolycopersici]
MTASRKVRVLYVDDDPALARLASKVLARSDFEVVHAPSISAGLDLFGTEEFAAVVLDHHFENQTGLNFLEAVAGSPSKAPILYVTGSSDAEVAIKALKGGAADYVMKSATDDFFPLLASALEQALENARLRNAKEEADRQLLIAKERAELLLSEMNHRIANSLSLVSAMIRMQVQIATSEETRTALSETQSRISAIAGVHRSLYTSDKVEAVELGAYMSSIIAEFQRTSGFANAITVRSDIANITTTADKAVSLGVILTELLTNAAKYAYPDGCGEVRVVLGTSGEDSHHLSVEDDGVGHDRKERPKGTGLGTRLINAMALTLGATVANERPGKTSGTFVGVIWKQ